MRIGRRRFLRDSVALPPLIAALFAAAVTVSCQDSSDDSTGEPASGTPDDGTPDDGTPTGDVAGAITGNHGHTCVITGAELDAGNAVVLTLTEGSGHTHSLSLSMTEVTNIAAGTLVAQTSTTDSGHSHLVTFNQA